MLPLGKTQPQSQTAASSKLAPPPHTHTPPPPTHTHAQLCRGGHTPCKVALHQQLELQRHQLLEGQPLPCRLQLSLAARPVHGTQRGKQGGQLVRLEHPVGEGLQLLASAGGLLWKAGWAAGGQGHRALGVGAAGRWGYRVAAR